LNVVELGKYARTHTHTQTHTHTLTHAHIHTILFAISSFNHLRPPEKFRKKDKMRIGFSSDLWAYGITVLQLLESDTYAPYGRGIDVPNIITQVRH